MARSEKSPAGATRSEFIKDKSGIAVACGLPLPPAGKKTSQANKKRAALWAAVTEWVSGAGCQVSGDARCAVSGVRLADLPPFPAKVKSGPGKGLWRREEVEAWNRERAKAESRKQKAETQNLYEVNYFTTSAVSYLFV